MKLTIIGTGWLAHSFYNHLCNEHKDVYVNAILTRRHLKSVDNFSSELLTNDIDTAIKDADVVVELTGDPVWATDVIYECYKNKIPVVTMNSEFHVTTGSWFRGKMLLTEAKGDQPGCFASLKREVESYGFKPFLLLNHKNYISTNPNKHDMQYWSDTTNTSLSMTTSATDGTKVKIEQVLCANGLGFDVFGDDFLGFDCSKDKDDLKACLDYYYDEFIQTGKRFSDYIIYPHEGKAISIVCTHNENQQNQLSYFGLGQYNNFYKLTKNYYLCHLEIMDSVYNLLNKNDILLDNGIKPKYGVGAIAKKTLRKGRLLRYPIGNFDYRGICFETDLYSNYVPIGLLKNCRVVKTVRENEPITWEHVDVPESLALKLYEEITCI